MKDTSIMSAESAGAAAGLGFLAKVGVAAGLGILGAAVMAAFDPPQSRKELFLMAATAGVGSMVFGPVALLLVASWLPAIAASELLIPVYFLTGALSWGAFGALAKLRKLVADKGAQAVADKVGLK